MPKWKSPIKPQRPKEQKIKVQQLKFQEQEGLMLLGDGVVAEANYIMACQDDPNFKWVKEEAAVDSGAIDCVANADRFPHLKVMETAESRRGDCWTCAGGKSIKKEGEVEVEWTTNEGLEQKVKIKIGKVNRTLISVDKLLERGHEVILSRKSPRIITQNGQVITLRRKFGMFLLDMWHKVPVKSSASVFTRQGS